MDLFQAKDYREIISHYLDSEPQHSRGKKTELSEKLGMHSSHLSQIISGNRSLTPDQALVLARLLGLSELEVEYLLTLVHEERASSFEFKKYCQQKLKEIQKKSQKPAERFTHQKQLSEEDKSQFYSHYLYSAIRLFCSTEEKGRTLEEIRSRFDISRERLMPILRFLLEAALLVQKKEHYSMGITSTFLPRESPHIHRHHANWRLLAVHESTRLEDTELMFTAPMSISKKDFTKIREDLLKQISKMSPIIQDSPAEEVACLNIDFFWVKK